MQPPTTGHSGAAGAPAPRRIRGFIETHRPMMVSGWAHDADRSDQPVTVTVSLDGATLGQAVADKFRQDLEAAGVGDGRKGFFIQLDPHVSREDLPYLEVGVVTADGHRARLRHLSGRAPWPRTPVSERAPDTAAGHGQQRPVFIIGSRRSGTSAIMQALRDNTSYQGHYEGHLLDLPLALETRAASFYVEKFAEWTMPDRWTMLGEVTEAELRAALREMFRSITGRLFPDDLWLDKTPTPEMIRSVPLLRDIWPQARFIFMRRRAHENVASQGRKFAHESLTQRCRWWADSMSAWLDVRDQTAGCGLELDQLHVATDPVGAARVVGEFLQLDATQTDRVARALGSMRPERTQREPATTLSDLPAEWTMADRAVFDDVCRPLLAQFGYGEREHYFISDDPALRWRRI